MNKFITFLRVCVALILVAFILLSPARLRAALNENPYREFLGGGNDEGWGGIITLWHVVDFKTYQGSVTAFLESCAAKYEKANSGVYVEVTGLSVEAAVERISRGERPDVWSLPLSRLNLTDLQTLTDAQNGGISDIQLMEKVHAYNDGGLKALPYIMSGYYIIGNTLLLAELDLQFPSAAERDNIGGLMQSAIDAKSAARYGALCAPNILAARFNLKGKLANDGDFKAGQVPFMIGDARALGDILRREDAFTIDALPLGGYTDQVQYIGIDMNASLERASHGAGIIAMILGEQQQSKLTALGALPTIRMAEAPSYSESMLKSMYEAYQEPLIPNPAEYAKQLDMLKTEAQDTLNGDASAKASFDKRMRELLEGAVP